MKDKWIINKLKWMLIFGGVLLASILIAGCGTLKNCVPKDGIIYSGGTMTIIQSNGHQVIIKK